jgi:hypothetical protein
VPGLLGRRGAAEPAWRFVQLQRHRQAGTKAPYVFGYIDLLKDRRIFAQLDGEVGSFRCDSAVESRHHREQPRRPTAHAFATATTDVETVYRAMMTGKYAMRAARDMHATVALVVVKNRRHAVNSPHASRRRGISVEVVVGSPMINSPLMCEQCCSITDGTGAVVVCSAEMAKRPDIAEPIRLAGTVMRSGPYHNRPRDITSDDIITVQLYEESGIGPEDGEIVELHDAFAISELLYHEAWVSAAKARDWVTHATPGHSRRRPRGQPARRHALVRPSHRRLGRGADRGQCQPDARPVPRLPGRTVAQSPQCYRRRAVGTLHAACTMHMLVRND